LAAAVMLSVVTHIVAEIWNSLDKIKFEGLQIQYQHVKNKFEGLQIQYQHVKNKYFAAVNPSGSIAAGNMKSNIVEFKILNAFSITCRSRKAYNIFEVDWSPLDAGWIKCKQMELTLVMTRKQHVKF